MAEMERATTSILILIMILSSKNYFGFMLFIAAHGYGAVPIAFVRAKQHYLRFNRNAKKQRRSKMPQEKMKDKSSMTTKRTSSDSEANGNKGQRVFDASKAQEQSLVSRTYLNAGRE